MGSKKASIFIIGEAPGDDEDDQGIPFVGKSGKLLDKILKACAFNRNEHVFMGTIVKCRPPSNRHPKPQETETCFPYLLKQIEMINPLIIVVLGQIALQTLIDQNAKISQMRGKWIPWNGRLVMPTYDPSALFKKQALKA